MSKNILLNSDENYNVIYNVIQLSPTYNCYEFFVQDKKINIEHMDLSNYINLQFNSEFSTEYVLIYICDLDVFISVYIKDSVMYLQPPNYNIDYIQHQTDLSMPLFDLTRNEYRLDFNTEIYFNNILKTSYPILKSVLDVVIKITQHGNKRFFVIINTQEIALADAFKTYFSNNIITRY